MYKTLQIAQVFLIALLLVGCGNQREVTRIDPEKQTDLSGRWNDTDSRMVAEEMVKDALNRSWITRFEEKNDKRPTIIIGEIKNKTHEHINPETFIKDMEREFINRDRIRVVQSGEFREKLRDERADQQKYASLETQKDWGKELGADFMVTGIMSSVVDQYKAEKVISYQVNLELTDLETNEKVWIGDKKIKKYVKH